MPLLPGANRPIRRKAGPALVFCRMFWPVIVVRRWRASCPLGPKLIPSSALAEASAHGPVGLPVIEAAGAPLRFALYEPGMPMVEGAFKALIPAELTWMVPEIVIVPLVAWDVQGGRLGYGGGYYDRTLEGLRARGPVLAIGFAFNAQQADALPLEPTDQPLDMIVTEDRIVQFSH